MSVQERTITPQDDLVAAVAATPQKGTLILAKGVYSLKECLVVDKTMTLKSESVDPNDVRIIRPGSTVLLITDGKPTFEALTILATQGSGNDPNVDVPIKYEGAVAVREKGAPTFVNCQASSKDEAAFSIFGKKASIKIVECGIKDVGGAGVYFREQGSGVIEDSFIENTDQSPQLRDNPHVVGCGCVEVEDRGFAEVRRSMLVSGPNRAVIIHNHGSAKLVECEVSAPDNQCVWLQEDSSLTATNTNFTSCNRKRGKRGVTIVNTDGIYLHDSYAEIENCQFNILCRGIALIENSRLKLNACVFNDVGAPLMVCDDKSNVKSKIKSDRSQSGRVYDFGFDEDPESQLARQPFSEEDTDRASLVKECYLNDFLNEPSNIVIQTPGAFEDGGNLPNYYYPNSKYGGTFLVSKELATPDFNWPDNEQLQSFELAIATRDPLPFGQPEAFIRTPLAVPNGQENRNLVLKYMQLNKKLSYVAHMLETGITIRRYQTIGIPDEISDADIAGSLFIVDILDQTANATPPSSSAAIDRLPDEYKRQLEKKYPGIIQRIANDPTPEKDNDPRPYFGLMVLIEITYSELEQIMTHDYREGFINDLKAANQWPFSDLDKRKPLF